MAVISTTLPIVMATTCVQPATMGRRNFYNDASAKQSNKPSGDHSPSTYRKQFSHGTFSNHQ